MGLWEEAFRNICGSVQLVETGNPPAGVQDSPELIAVACLRLLCCDVIGHRLKLVSDQQSCKSLKRVSWGGSTGFHHTLPSSPIRVETSPRCVAPLVSVMPGIPSPRMVPVASLRCFLHLIWAFVIWPNRFKAFANILIGKILAFGNVD